MLLKPKLGNLGLNFTLKVLHYVRLTPSLNRKSETIFMKVLIIQWAFTHYIIVLGTDFAPLLPLFLL